MFIKYQREWSERQFGTGMSTAIDTGTTLIGAPTAAVEAIWSSVPGAQALTGQMAGFWSFRTYLHVFPMFPWRVPTPRSSA